MTLNIGSAARDPETIDPIDDRRIKVIERQIDQIEFTKLPSSMRADVLGLLHTREYVTVGRERGRLVARVHPKFVRLIASCVAASKVL